MPTSASVSTSVASRSGDASSGLTTPLQYNGGFNVGSGSQSTAAASNGGTGGSSLANNLPLYIGLAIAGILVLGGLAIYAKRS